MEKEIINKIIDKTINNLGKYYFLCNALGKALKDTIPEQSYFKLFHCELKRFTREEYHKFICGNYPILKPYLRYSWFHPWLKYMTPEDPDYNLVMESKIKFLESLKQ